MSALSRVADQPEIRRPSLCPLRQDVGLTMKKQPPKPQPKPPKPKPVKGKVTSLGWASDTDPIYGEPRPKDKGKYRGLVPDTDPIYDCGWRFVMGTYLNPHIKPKKEKGR